MVDQLEFWALIISAASLAASTVLAPYAAHRLSLRRMRQELEQGKELALHEARVQYQIEAQRKLAETVGSAKGQVLDAAYDLHRRLQNLHTNAQKRWGGTGTWLGDARGHYFSTSVYRIVRLIAWIEILNDSLAFVDQSVPGADEERRFLNHLRLIMNSFSDTRLFDGLPYDSFFEKDHIFADNLVAAAEQVILESDDRGRRTVMKSGDFTSKFQAKSPAFRKKFASVTGLLLDFDMHAERPLTWSRLVAIHHSVTQLLRRYGYDFQKAGIPSDVLQRLHDVPDSPEYSATKVNANIAVLVRDCGL